MGKIQILAADSAIDAGGQEWNFTKGDLEQIVKNFDPRLHRVPLLAGHNESQPAKARIESLELGEDDQGRPAIFAGLSDFVDGVKSELNKGLWAGISSAIYPPDYPANPYKGEYALRHVGLVQIPALKGMNDPAVAEFSEGAIVPKQIIKLNEFIDSLVSQGMRGIREYMIATSGIEIANEHLPARLVDSIAAESQRQTEDALPMFTENTTSEGTMTEEELKAAKQKLEADKEKLEADRKALETSQQELATGQESLDKEKFDSELGELVKEGKIPEGERETHLAALMEAKRSGGFIELGETKRSIWEQYLLSLKSRKPIELSEGEIASDGKSPKKVLEDLEQTEVEELAFAEIDKAKAAGKDLSFSAAIRIVKKQFG